MAKKEVKVKKGTMKESEERTTGLKKHAAKLEEAGLGPWRYVFSIVAFVVTLILLPSIFKGSQSFWDGLAWFYLVMAALAAVIDVIRGDAPLRITVILFLFFSYIMRIFAEILLIALCVPVLALMFVLGPVMFLLCLISLGMAGMYFIVEILGIPIKGVTIPYGGLTALGALAACLISGFVFFRAIDKTEGLLDAWLDKIFVVYLFIIKPGHRRSCGT